MKRSVYFLSLIHEAKLNLDEIFQKHEKNNVNDEPAESNPLGTRLLVRKIDRTIAALQDARLLAEDKETEAIKGN